MNELDDIIGGAFKELYVRKIIEAREWRIVFFLMYRELNVTTNHHIQVFYLNRISVTKESLLDGSRVEIACYLQSWPVSVPLLENSVLIADRIGELQEEKIDDQARTLELQRELI